MEHDVIVVSDENTVGNRDNVLLSPIAKMLRSSAGKAALAASMAAPLRRRLDYQSIARKVFAVEPMPPGALPIYDKDDQ